MKTVFLCITLIASILGHSYVTNPIPRNLEYNCRIGGPPQYPMDCPGPCEAKKDDTANQNIHPTSRGAALTVDWPRNNHGGGFIRLAWAKHEDSDDFQAFNQGVQQVTCHETGYDGNPANTSPNRGCASDDPTNLDGGDSGGPDGGDRACRLRTTVPTWLADGLWTMQWTWYGSGGGYLGDYYSCTDFQVSGGAALTAQAAPVFKGGDVTYPNENTCKFWNTDRPHYCWSEPCNDIWNSSFLFPNGIEQKGKAYLVPLAITGNPTSDAPTQTPTPDPTTAAPTDAGDVPDIKASVTVSLNVAPKLVDLTVFVYEVSGNLGIPSSAIPSVVVDIDQSTDTVTIIHFEILNKLLADGTRVDPIAAAYKLKQMADDQNSSLKGTALLSTMKVLDVQSEDQSKSTFVGSQTFVIIIAVVGGALVIGIVIAVVVVVVKKRRNTFF